MQTITEYDWQMLPEAAQREVYDFFFSLNSVMFKSKLIAIN